MWDRGQSTSFNMVLVESLGTVSYSPSMLTMTYLQQLKRYSASKNGLTLKSGFMVVQAHWKWRGWIDNVWLSIVLHCNYSSVLYHFRVIWRLIISWPWSIVQRLLKVIETGVIWKLGCGFLFACYSNYGDILYRLRNIASYWQKIAKYYTPCACI